MHRPIAISLSPNTEADDYALARRNLFSPWRWGGNGNAQALEEEFVRMFGPKYHAITVNSGRSGLYLILKALGVDRGDEVCVQAFTCVAVPNAVIWAGAKPKYVDIDNSYNLDPEDLVKKIGRKTKAVILQHTFGTPANIDEIRKIVKEKNIFLIEDCAHALGLTIAGSKAGTFGDASFFSFGRDKIISSVFGGMILCSNEALYHRLRRFADRIEDPPFHWTAQQLFHPVAMSVILPIYRLGAGKMLLFVLQKAGLLSKAVYEEEKFGDQPKYFPQKLPGTLALLALNQLKKLDRFNHHRQRISSLYFKELRSTGFILPPETPESIWLRFPVRHKYAKAVFNYAKARGVLLGDWYRGILPPCPVPEKVFYKMGECPRAERYAESILNLPTYPTLAVDEARKVITILKQWENSRKK